MKICTICASQHHAAYACPHRELGEPIPVWTRQDSDYVRSITANIGPFGSVVLNGGSGGMASTTGIGGGGGGGDRYERTAMAIINLINTKPRSPTLAEIVAILKEHQQ